MNYCVYFKETGELYSATPVPVSDDKLDYIEITPEIMDDFLNRRKSLIHYIVIPDYKIPHTGRLINKEELNQNWAKKEDTLYLLPLGNESDFTIKQNAQLKTCTLEISQVGMLTLTSKRISKIVVAACSLGNPFTPLWLWEVDPAKLNSISYIGTDDIRFYTKRVLESYAHDTV